LEVGSSVLVFFFFFLEEKKLGNLFLFTVIFVKFLKKKMGK